MVSLASARKELEETKRKLRRLQEEQAVREARRDASGIFKAAHDKDVDRDSFRFESKIFADRRWLQPTCDPPNLSPIGREAYVDALHRLLAAALQGGAGRNVFVVGPPGTGKTLTTKFVLGQLKEYVKNRQLAADAVFVNAGRTRSPYHTLLEILRSLGIDAPPAGWQLGRLKEEFEQRRGNNAVVIAIDEADSLVSKTREQLLYYLNRQENVTLLLITNSWDDLAKLPARARSTLQLAPLIFEPYSKDEARRILDERCAFAFKPEVVDQEIIDRAASFAAEMRDIRTGFNLLLTAGLLADGQARDKVDLLDLEKAAKAIRPTI